MNRPAMDRVLQAWALSEPLHARARPSTTASFDACQFRLGRRLPTDLRTVHSVAGSGAYFGGLLAIEPLLPPEQNARSLCTTSDLLRRWDWPVPNDLVVFAANAVDGVFGLWLPNDAPDQPVVVHVTGDAQREPLSIVGDDLPSFLRGYSAAMLRHAEVDEEVTLDVTAALDALGLPPEFRVPEPQPAGQSVLGRLAGRLSGATTTDEDHVDEEAILAWASPRMPTDAGGAIPQINERDLRLILADWQK